MPTRRFPSVPFAALFTAGAAVLLAACLDTRMPTAPISATQKPALLDDAPVCVPKPAGMVSWWPAEGDANDRQHVANGTPIGGVTYAPGMVGQAWQFDGTSGYIQMPNGGIPFGSAPRTVMLWVKTTNDSWVGNQNTIFHSGASFARSLSFSLDMDQFPVMEFYTWGGPPIHDILFDTGVQQRAGWIHVALTFDGTTLKAYSQGVLRGTAVPDVVITISGPWTIGTWLTGNAFFDGEIDEFMTFNRALDPSEIAAVYNAGSAGVCGPETKPTASIAASGGVTSGALQVYTGTHTARVIPTFASTNQGHTATATIDWGDGASSDATTGVEATHDYANFGPRTVTLTAHDNALSTTATTQVQVQPGWVTTVAPVTSPIIAPISAGSSPTLSMTVSSAAPAVSGFTWITPDAPSYSYTWTASFNGVSEPLSSFDVGNTTIDVKGPTRAGSYHVALAVADQFGGSANGGGDFIIAAPPAGGTLSVSPVPAMSYSDPLTLVAAAWTTTSQQPLSYTFTRLTRQVPGGTSTADVISAAGPSASRIVLPLPPSPANGTDSIAVTVTDVFGQSATITQPISIASAAQAPALVTTTIGTLTTTGQVSAPAATAMNSDLSKVTDFVTQAKSLDQVLEKLDMFDKEVDKQLAHGDVTQAAADELHALNAKLRASIVATYGG